MASLPKLEVSEEIGARGILEHFHVERIRVLPAAITQGLGFAGVVYLSINHLDKAWAAAVVHLRQAAPIVFYHLHTIPGKE